MARSDARFAELSTKQFIELARELTEPKGNEDEDAWDVGGKNYDLYVETIDQLANFYRHLPVESLSEESVRRGIRAAAKHPRAKKPGCRLYLCSPGRAMGHRLSDVVVAETVRLKQQGSLLEAELVDAREIGRLLDVHPDLIGSYFPATTAKRKKVDPDDPHRGAFGGAELAGNRRLYAIVKTLGKQWYSVKLAVHSTDIWSHPLKGKVRFFLHPSFEEDKPLVRVVDGRAERKVSCYGAFTVGAKTDDGVSLELDLSTCDAPRGFLES